MISAVRNSSYLNKLLIQGQVRQMSTASASIKSRFEAAYEERVKTLSKSA